MGKKSDFWTHPQNRRAACLAMAIRHADAASYNYDADDVIEHAAMFGDYIMTGEVPSMDDKTVTTDGASEPAIGVHASSGTRFPESCLAAPVTKAGETDKNSADAGSVSKVENEKREIEKRLASAQKLGLRLVGLEIVDGSPSAEWIYRGPVDFVVTGIVQAAAEDISSRIGRVFDAGFIIRAVHYDADGFPCVSWSPVSAAA
ncbi:hypothetical protein SXCC_04768 [Gluconacetobacter sp. SXCC-1]|uniref:hypothetical protein n=1 Tax=Komagataeibacter rhaeticus TaxID=215221 RepID=UPI000207FA06|nr:hypothetical protein [Komagataeibacter rhaeticus]ATU72652.1 hypothetical protein CT154_07150 [Komagataeibacter xylinus]EGG74665.1 hypothetical protein SXCC_04768 [Gluconacetobacter sp. SXCC-1]WPP22415.1 hypothetical protein SCD25_02655 [Komagataeibacter rhaeticus]